MLKYINGGVLDTDDNTITPVTEDSLIEYLRLGISIEGVKLVGNSIKYTGQKKDISNDIAKSVALDHSGCVTGVYYNNNASGKAVPIIDLSQYKGLSSYIELKTNAFITVPDSDSFHISYDFTVKTDGRGFFDLRGIKSASILRKFRQALVSSGFGSLLEKVKHPTEHYSSYSIKLGFIILTNKQFELFLS